MLTQLKRWKQTHCLHNETCSFTIKKFENACSSFIILLYCFISLLSNTSSDKPVQSVNPDKSTIDALPDSSHVLTLSFDLHAVPCTCLWAFVQGWRWGKSFLQAVRGGVGGGERCLPWPLTASTRWGWRRGWGATRSWTTSLGVLVSLRTCSAVGRPQCEEVDHQDASIYSPSRGCGLDDITHVLYPPSSLCSNFFPPVFLTRP